MEFGFAMLIPTLSSIYLSLNKNKLLYYAISIFYSFYLVLYSHRGAMLCLGVFIIIMCIYYLLNMKLTRKNMILISFIIALVITIYLKLDDLIIGLLRFLESRNMESRTLRLLLEGNLGNDSGRGFIQDFFISNLGNNLLGNGLYGDRYLYSVGNGIATYPHNLFLELCIDFGIIIGTLLSIFLIFYSVKNYLWNKTISFEYFAFISIFFCASFVQLLISSSFLASIPLWIYISLLFTKEKDFWGNLENKEFY
ncbi:hypothetical protein HED35_02330 [Vagococcus fluvialis]|uniref:O-antigen ligase-related domain-containing protein n=2 Tax=Vagococcus fluvialis TaxID=2738 RepID=A0A7X6D6T7_9ENTE|nr:O-antigen ligase family protein [Vagococcus fluvialis]NKC66916.1 hypothetical protein [Vagococcus fluvialis]